MCGLLTWTFLTIDARCPVFGAGFIPYTTFGSRLYLSLADGVLEVHCKARLGAYVRVAAVKVVAVACCWNAVVHAADPSGDERPGRVPAGDEYRVVFSTYLGGTKWDHARDVVVDAEGNTYVVVGTGSSKADGFPVTDGAYQVLRKARWRPAGDAQAAIE